MPAEVLPDGGWAYFDRTGLVRVKDVAPFDNGASYFHSGLVRILHDGKYGLANDRGVLATPLYDGMNEFDKDHQGWKACNSCRLTKHGEHSWFEGGHWFWLDRRGRVAGPAKEAAHRRRVFKALKFPENGVLRNFDLEVAENVTSGEWRPEHQCIRQTMVPKNMAGMARIRSAGPSWAMTSASPKPTKASAL